MSASPERLPVADQIRKGLEEAIRHARGEITLKATVVELPDRPPEVPAERVAAKGTLADRRAVRRPVRAGRPGRVRRRTAGTPRARR